MAQRVVCIIDDDEEIIDLVRLILTRRNFTVIGATNGQAGVEMAIHEQPDVVLLDLMMPDIDGWAVLEQLRSNPATRQIPVVLLSGAKQTSKLSIGGIDGVIYKPFGPRELVEGILAALGEEGSPSGG